MKTHTATTEQEVSTFRRHQYENDDKTFWSDAYTVPRLKLAVAWRVLGWELEPDDDTEWTGIYQRTGQVLAIMVGDDSVHWFEPDDLQPLSVEQFCGSCGQIGCSHGC
jgi:hypothetical protein